MIQCNYNDFYLTTTRHLNSISENVYEILIQNGSLFLNVFGNLTHEWVLKSMNLQ